MKVIFQIPIVTVTAVGFCCFSFLVGTYVCVVWDVLRYLSAASCVINEYIMQLKHRVNIIWPLHPNVHCMQTVARGMYTQLHVHHRRDYGLCLHCGEVVNTRCLRVVLSATCRRIL